MEEFGDVISTHVKGHPVYASAVSKGISLGPEYLVSESTTPSSTHAMLVFVAPMSTTQAFDIPAPYVAASDSCSPTEHFVVHTKY